MCSFVHQSPSAAAVFVVHLHGRQSTMSVIRWCIGSRSPYAIEQHTLTRRLHIASHASVHVHRWNAVHSVGAIVRWPEAMRRRVGREQMRYRTRQNHTTVQAASLFDLSTAPPLTKATSKCSCQACPTSGAAYATTTGTFAALVSSVASLAMCE